MTINRLGATSNIMPRSESSNTEEFYDRISSEYTSKIERCVPRYHEMHQSILRYIPADLKPEKILELGCGSGVLSELILKEYPVAELHVVDVSQEMLDLCRARLPSGANVVCHHADFRQLDFAAGRFDLVASSISIHHLEDPAKQILFGKIWEFLSDRGVLVYSDQFAGATPEIHQHHKEEWKSAAFRAGCTEEEWALWAKHEEEQDFHASLESQWKWLQEAGFSNVDCPWRYLLWTILIARKSAVSTDLS